MGIVWIAAAVVLLLLISFIAGTFYFFSVAFKRSRPKIAKGKPRVKLKRENTCPDYWENSRAWFDSQPKETLSITSEDGLTLKASLIKGESLEKIALILHGWTGERRETGSLAQLYQKLGFSCLSPDMRASGESDGKYYGFGFKDKGDALLWINEAVSMGAKEIVVTGQSMGGATVMMLAGEKLPPEVKFLVEDCGFSSLGEQFKVVLPQMLPRALHFMIPGLMLLTNQLNFIVQGFHFKDASAVNALKHATRPVLFIHGVKDEFVPYKMLKTCYDACVSPKEMLTVQGAEHCKSIAAEPALYEQAVRAFALKYIDEN